jgi:hypothetical protein
MKIQEFNKQNLGDLRIKLVSALKSFEEEFGVAVNIGSISFSSDSFHTKMSVSIVNESDRGESSRDIQLKKDFFKYCLMFGLEKTDIGKEIIINRGKATIVGIMPSSRKYPIVVKTLDNKYVKLDSTYAKSLIK